VLVTDRGEVVAELSPPGHTAAGGEVAGAMVALAKRGQATGEPCSRRRPFIGAFCE